MTVSCFVDADDDDFEVEFGTDTVEIGGSIFRDPEVISQMANGLQAWAAGRARTILIEKAAKEEAEAEALRPRLPPANSAWGGDRDRDVEDAWGDG